MPVARRCYGKGAPSSLCHGLNVAFQSHHAEIWLDPVRHIVNFACRVTEDAGNAIIPLPFRAFDPHRVQP
jgi:hypothetical protein